MTGQILAVLRGYRDCWIQKHGTERSKGHSPSVSSLSEFRTVSESTYLPNLFQFYPFYQFQYYTFIPIWIVWIQGRLQTKIISLRLFWEQQIGWRYPLSASPSARLLKAMKQVIFLILRNPLQNSPQQSSRKRAQLHGQFLWSSTRSKTSPSVHYLQTLSKGDE